MKKITPQTTKKLFLTDQANFKEIREQGGVYVDKTKQIYNCIGKGKYFFLARPRRFGKSTLCRTLEQLFLGNRKIFKGLWIDKSDWAWKKHPIIYLDMTLAAGRTSNALTLKKALSTTLLDIASNYGVKIDKTDTPTAQFKGLIQALSQKFSIGVAVIIDEYDKPILDQIVTGKPHDEHHAIISDLYGQLKSSEQYLRFAFLTGVFKFTKTSVFSSLNNLNDLTFATQASDLVGYTQEELESNFAQEIDLLAHKKQLSSAETINLLQAEYNGYCFGFDRDTAHLCPTVYNPFAVNHTFAANQMLEKWFASGSPSFLIEKIKQGEFQAVEPKGLQIDFSALDESCSPANIQALPLMYYAGYATIAEYDKNSNEVHLRYPNAEVARTTASRLTEIFNTGTQQQLIRIALEISNCFKNNDLSQLEELLEMAFAQLTYQLFVSQEKYFQSMIMLILIMGRLRVEAEVPSLLGRADLVVYLPNRIFIIETKFNESPANGLDQIKNKKYMTKFLAMKLPIEAVGINVNVKKSKTKKSKLIDVAYENIYRSLPRTRAKGKHKAPAKKQAKKTASIKKPAKKRKPIQAKRTTR